MMIPFLHSHYLNPGSFRLRLPEFILLYYLYYYMNNKEIPEDANENCPGLGSENAGKESSCEGCPNQKNCQSGEKMEEDPAVEEVKKKLKNIKNIILVLSGKGGVGKSTISSQLAMALAHVKDQSYQVGLLDVDICGPSIPRMLGLEKEEVHQSLNGMNNIMNNLHKFNHIL